MSPRIEERVAYWGPEKGEEYLPPPGGQAFSGKGGSRLRHSKQGWKGVASRGDSLPKDMGLGAVDSDGFIGPAGALSCRGEQERRLQADLGPQELWKPQKECRPQDSVSWFRSHLTGGSISDSFACWFSLLPSLHLGIPQAQSLALFSSHLLSSKPC